MKNFFKKFKDILKKTNKFKEMLETNRKNSTTIVIYLK